MKTTNLLPAAVEGYWVRLRPIGRSDHPVIFAHRINAMVANRPGLVGRVPTFEEWEAGELAEIKSSAAAMVAELHDGTFCGLLSLYKLNERDQRGYVQWLSAGALDSNDCLESMCIWFDYLFNRRNLRKLYWELSGAQVLEEALVSNVGFVEEVRQKDFLWLDGRALDLVHYALPRDRWQVSRVRLADTLMVAHALATERP